LNFLLGNVCHISFKCHSLFSGMTFYFLSCHYNIMFHLPVRLVNLLADSNIYIDVSDDTEFQVVPLCNLLQGIFLHCAAQVTFYFFLLHNCILPSVLSVHLILFLSVRIFQRTKHSISCFLTSS
jgi:hypothetical protein